MYILDEIISFKLINALGWTILHSIWQAAAIAIILGLVLIVLRKKTPNLKYLISIIAMLIVLCLSIFTFYSYYSLADAGKSNLPGLNQQFHTVAPLLKEIEPIIPNPATSKTISLNITGYLQDHLSSFVAIWFVGIIFFLIKYTAGFVYSFRIKTYKTLPITKSWQNKINHLCEKMKIKKSVFFLQSELIKTPMVIGYFKPVILLPVSVLTGIPADQIETIIIHELAHIYRRDYLVNIFQSMIEILYFYHPAVWWISRIMRIERENCCDDIVIQVSNNSLNYAKALSVIEITRMAPVRSTVALISQKNTLLDRIKRITHQPVSSINISRGLISSVLIIVFIISIALSADNAKFLDFDNSDEWWNPIIQKHNIQLRAFSNFEYVLENGEKNQIDNNERIITDASIIINTGDNYLIITSPKVVYTYKDSTYILTHAELNRYSYNDPEPISKGKGNCEKLKIKLSKNLDGTPYFTITNLDKPRITNSEKKWFPKKYSKIEPLITRSIQDQSGEKSVLSGEWHSENWTKNDSISTGNDVIFKTWHGVELEANQLKFNNNTETFETDLLKFLIMNNKVIINFITNPNGKYKYCANEIYHEGRFIYLLGNASFKTDKTQLKANEIIIDLTI